ncbi:MAG: NAD(P)-dependent oxidoreductase [Bacteroidetes Order II. Incertae sedis bacterium]|nr:NAD(P)-dependent oxidoreductase [Bacteroidetes Order II. bacterium]
MEKNQPILGFIGTGVMGKSMAGHWLKAGYEVWVYNRTREKLVSLLEMGAKEAQSVADIAQHAQVIATMLGFPTDVEDIYLGENGLIANGSPAQLLVDFTTSSPDLARKIAGKAREKGISTLDAPVSGGDTGAREARLSIMCGGAEEAFKTAWPLLNLLGQNILHHGPDGAGQHAKMCNQITIAGMMMSVMEALAYAKSADLDPEKMLTSVGSGAATSWTLQNLMPRVLKGDLNPGFFVAHFIKDMDIALHEAEKRGLELPALRLARQQYQRLADMGYAHLGTHALWLVYEDSLG